MKKELFNILFLGTVVLAVVWLYWSGYQAREPNKYILALSWQPAFCERKPNKPECRSQHKRRFDANNFSLHGLWPQPSNNVYCGVSKNIIKLDKRGRWNELPKLEISGRWRKELSRVMPGYRSNLHRHEWYKHGTCMGQATTPLGYFRVSMQMLETINKSPLRDLFKRNIGKEVTATQIVRIMESHFGKGMGKRITISCKKDGKRTLINEIKLSIAIPNSHSLPDLEGIIKISPEIPIGCKSGMIDPVGLQ